MAVLNVVVSNPLPGEFTSIQAAVNAAAPGDTIKLAATPAQGGFAESVNLSLMGSARPGGVQVGDLTIVGDSVSTGSVIIPPGTTTANGTAFFNSAPFTGNLTFSYLTLRPFTATAGEDKGIKLANVTGNITINNTLVLDAVDAGIEIISSGGASGTQSRIAISDVAISSSGTVLTGVGIRLADIRALASLDHTTIADATTGMSITTTSSIVAGVTMRNVDFDGWNDDLGGKDGLVLNAAGSSSLQVNVAFSDFTDIPENSIEALVGDTAKLAVNVYENSAFAVYSPITRTLNEPATKFTAQGLGQLSVTFDNNIFDNLAADGISIQALHSAKVNAVLHQNFMTNVGRFTGAGGTTPDTSIQPIFIQDAASSTATINARITNNQIFDATGSAILVNPLGSSTYHLGILNNSILYSTSNSANAGIDVSVNGSTLAPKLNMAIRGNEVDGTGNGIRLQRTSTNTQMQVEWVTSTGVTTLEQYLLANNTIPRATLAGNFSPIAVGTFAPFLPLRLGDVLWRDTNKNGLQDANEESIGGVEVTLTGTETASGAAVSQKILSEGDRGYLFGALLPGTYTVSLGAPPTGLDLTGLKRKTPSTTDIDDQFDSDFRQGIRQAQVTLVSGIDNLDLDAGFVPTNGFIWQNQLNKNDISDDGVIAPQDALQVIIELNTRGAGLIPAPAGLLTPAPFVDADGDGRLTPSDALQVIIHLNTFGAGVAEYIEPTFIPRQVASGWSLPLPSPTNSEPSSSAALYFAPEFFYGTSQTKSDESSDEETSAIDAFFATLD